MDLNFETEGKFVSETSELIDELEADAILLIVFGSKKGSGCCCEMRVRNPERMAKKIIDSLRDLADSMEVGFAEAIMPPDEDDGHEQTLN